MCQSNFCSQKFVVSFLTSIFDSLSRESQMPHLSRARLSCQQRQRMDGAVDLHLTTQQTIPAPDSNCLSAESNFHPQTRRPCCLFQTREPKKDDAAHPETNVAAGV